MASWLIRLLASGLIFNATFPLDAVAAPSPVSVAQPVPAQPFNEEQLDALLASIALYPDELLTQLLMASGSSGGARPSESSPYANTRSTAGRDSVDFGQFGAPQAKRSPRNQKFPDSAEEGDGFELSVPRDRLRFKALSLVGRLVVRRRCV
jgi:hypothetical protein